MRLRPGLPVLWRGATEVQVGTDPRWSVTLADLSPAAARALTGTPPGSDVRLVRARLADAGVDEQEVVQTVRALADARLLVPRGCDTTAAADQVAAGLSSEDGDGGAVLRRRSAAVVRIEGLGRVGAAVAVALAAAGVGTVHPHDADPVTPADVGGALTALDRGRPRAVATAEAVLRAAPQARTVARRRPDVVVLVRRGAPDLVRARDLLSDDQPHLSVVVREASVLVGPLVRPGDGPCLRCTELARSDADERWPVLAPQLAMARHVGGGEATASTHVAVGLATALALGVVDGRTEGWVRVPGVAWEVSAPDGVPRLLRWDAHPACGCALPVG